MADERRLSFDLALEDLMVWNKFHLANSPTYRRTLFWSTWGFAIVIAGILVLWAVLKGEPAFAIFGICWGGLYLLYARYKVKRNIESFTRKMYSEGKNKGTLGPHTLRITTEGFVETSDSGESTTYWGGIERIEESPGYAFVYIGAMLAHVIPEARVTEGDFRAFVDELKRMWAQSQPSEA